MKSILAAKKLWQRKKVLIVIPTYNEADNIRKLFNEIFKVWKGFHILVIDDNSPDGTGKIVEIMQKKDKRIHLIKRPAKMGLGSGYVTGFKYALEKGFDYAIQMDADFSHDPSYLTTFLSEMNTSDVIIGSRYIHGISVVNWPLWRLLLSLGGSLYARIITGVKIKDMTAGFKCLKKEALAAIKLDRIFSDGYAFQIEIIYKCAKNGFKLKEVPIVFVDRRVGISKMSKGIVWEAMLTPWKLRLGL